MQKVFLLGSTSFVGRNIRARLSGFYNVVELARPQFDFLKPETFINIDFSNSIIIDCINVNNGNNTEIENCNIKGFQTFVNYIARSCISVKYLYFSTISVISEEIRNQNFYVYSKYIAENYLINEHKILHHIVRLSYPIGKGENKTRLVSRLIKSIKSGEILKLSDIRINITPVKCIREQINNLIEFETNKITFLSNNIYTSLIEVANIIGNLLNIKPHYTIIKSDNCFEPLAINPIECRVDLVKYIEEMI